MAIELSEGLHEALKLVASEHCIKKGMNLTILDREIVDGHGFYTFQGSKAPRATKVFPNGTIYCSCDGFRFHHMAEKKQLCSHLVGSMVDMANHGVDVPQIISKMIMG
jgi:hypothetical protein